MSLLSITYHLDLKKSIDIPEITEEIILKNCKLRVDKWVYPCYIESTEGNKPTEYTINGGNTMPPTEAERQDVKKAMAFDLFNIIDENPKQTTYTPEEIKKLIRIYIKTSEQK